MSTPLREGKFDVVLAAAPGLEVWPSVGVRALASLCAEMGLTVGVFGGEDVRVRGVIALPGTGGVVLAEDVQNRIHRIQARAVVKVKSSTMFPVPFPGWRSQGLIPLATARRLHRESQVQWDPGTVILGTGNPALRFGSELLESGVPEVICVESNPQWRAKRIAGWEVERRRFEVAGGEIVEATPVRLSAKAALLWEFRLQDAQGVRIVEVARVVSAGPFSEALEVREHPAGSLLFELDQTAGALPADDREGWVNEEERATWLGSRIVRALVSELGERKEELDSIYRRSRGRLRRYDRHLEEPFTPSYQGKWIASADSKRMRAFSGVPQEAQKKRAVASIECFEEIPCNLCQEACPTEAIRIGSVPRKPEERILREELCTACGLCLQACPSAATLMIEDPESRSVAKVTLPWRGARKWKSGEFAILLNRRGENLGSGRIVDELVPEGGEPSSVQLVQVEVPTHLAWEARGLRRARKENSEDEAYLASVSRSASAEMKVEITFNGEKRLVRDQVPLTIALFETAQNRPEDALFCKDGSCGLCAISVDGVKKLACQTSIHRGMAIRTRSLSPEAAAAAQADASLCPCLGISAEQVSERMKSGNLQSPEAVLSVAQVGEGSCRGQLCMGSFLRLLKKQGLDAGQWIDWRFPWTEWSLSRN